VGAHVGMEERELFRRVVGLGSEGYLLLRVRVAGSHGGGGDEFGHDEVPGKGGEDEYGEDGGQIANSLHAGNYRRERGWMRGRKSVSG